MTTTQEETPKEPVVVSKAKVPLATAYLASMFAAGLLLVYFVEPVRSTEAEPQALADRSGAGEMEAPVPPQVAEPTVSREAVAELSASVVALTEQLDETRGQVRALRASLERLERDELAALAAEQRRFADELSAMTDRARPAEVAADEPAASLEADAQLARDLTALGVEATPEGARLSLGEAELRFEPGKAELVGGRVAALTQVADLLAQHPEIRVLLRGHTDSSGEAAPNAALSEARARAVRARLASLGVSEARVLVEGAGESRPIADNATSEGRARNRRVELYLLEP